MTQDVTQNMEQGMARHQPAIDWRNLVDLDLMDDLTRDDVFAITNASRLCMLLEPCLLDLNEVVSLDPFARAIRIAEVVVAQAEYNPGIRQHLKESGVMDKLKRVAMTRHQAMTASTAEATVDANGEGKDKASQDRLADMGAYVLRADLAQPASTTSDRMKYV